MALIRNSKPRPMVMAADFSISIGGDMSKMSVAEYHARHRAMEDSMAESYLRTQAEKDPEGYCAKTYFTRVPDQ